ncbi:MAG: YicC family protein [Spirochaetia bacterium]|nr:YicC family protein [Spirochaetia bacterium]
MISMTGFASKELRTEALSLTIEVKSYNNRYLDIKHNMPSLFSLFETEIDNRIKEVASRGSVEITIRYKQFINTTTLTVNREIVEEYTKAFEEIREVAHIEDKGKISDYMALDGVIIQTNTLDPHTFEEPLFSLLNEVLEEFKKGRVKEGEATKIHIVSLLEDMKKWVATIQGYSTQIEEKLKETLKTKMKELMGNSEYDEGRFLQEIALLLIKYSIAEELNRLSTHFTSFDEIVTSLGSVGKKLDFLAQEINREINTIGSKSMIGEVNQLVVSLKDSLENIREQLRNIE